MDVGHARKVFFDGFFRNREGSTMEVPIVPLGELYGTRLEQWLRDHDVDVRLTTGVKAITHDSEQSRLRVTLRNGEQLPADFVISAVPFDRVSTLFDSDTLVRLPEIKNLPMMQSSPITGVHLWFDREVCPLEHAVLVGRTVQWVFNHSKLQGREAPNGGGQYLQLVISASYDLVNKTKDEILAIALDELAALWPMAREATLTRWWVVTEHGATFAVRPGIDAIRPPQRTPIEGLFLAGDWTATGWPATMEGAVRSGYLAAEGVLDDLGTPESVVQPDLPSGTLARLLLGSPAPPPPAQGAFAKINQ
jgi:squalene-associated FAD-dependent desaturase